LCHSCYRRTRELLDPSLKTKRNAGLRDRYQNDPEFRAKTQEINARTRAAVRADPERRAGRQRSTRDSWLRKFYGITIGQWEVMFAEQQGRCASCGDDLGPRAHTDHCHRTGVVRGILCKPCNQAAGLLLDSPDRARKLATYLERVAA
jgi:hypothetical protein